MSTAVLLDVQAALVQQMLAPASPPPPEQQCKSADTPLVAVMGWLGCVAAWLLFLAPMPTMRKIIRSRHIHEFSPLPYLISMLQCFLWTVYALPAVTPCKTQPLVTNGAGFVLELVYVLIFIRYAHAQRWAMLLKFAIVIAIAAFVCVAALVLAPHFDFKSFPDPDASRSTTVLGWTCSVFNVAMYAAPLSVVYTVLQRRSVRNMPLPLTLGCGLCSGFWTAYALMVLDMFILVPNLLGLLLFVVQISVYRWVSPFCGSSALDVADFDDFAGKPTEALVSPTADAPQQPYDELAPPDSTIKPVTD